MKNADLNVKLDKIPIHICIHIRTLYNGLNLEYGSATKKTIISASHIFFYDRYKL